jgi:hypothetical protein
VRRPQLNPIWLPRILHTPERPISANWFKEQTGRYVRPNPEKGGRRGSLRRMRSSRYVHRGGAHEGFAVIFFLLLLAIAIAPEALDFGWARFWLVAASS